MVIEAVLYVLLLIVGFFVMVKGADWLVDGASGIASKLKISSLVIGLTVVALGTSAPEAAVSTVSSITGNSGTAIGNIVGSNIVNILLILGICALMAQIPVEKSSRYIEIPFLLVITCVFAAFGFTNSAFTWWEGLILFVLYFVFTAYTVVMAKRKKGVLIEEATATAFAPAEVGAEQKPTGGFRGFLNKVSEKYEGLKQHTWFLIILTLVGLGCVVGGGIAVQQSAEYIAINVLHIPEMVVGLTIVAFGTSLPELVTSVSAARKGDMGIATGNVIGSNIANILFVGGLGFICSGANSVLVEAPLGFIIDCAVSLVAALALWFFSFGKKHGLGKVAGFALIGILVIYYTYLFLSAYGVITLPVV